MPEIDLKRLLPYGDTTNDGAVQFSFTLPVEPGPKARETATRLVAGWGFRDVRIAHMSKIGVGYSYFVVFGHTDRSIDYTKVEVPELSNEKRSYKEIDAIILEKFKRPLRVVGACTG